MDSAVGIATTTPGSRHGRTRPASPLVSISVGGSTGQAIIGDSSLTLGAWTENTPSSR